MDKNPIRVLQIIRTMNMGGAENFIMNVYRNIDKNKVQFDFLVSGKGVFDDEIKKLGGKIYYIPYITDIGQIKYVIELKKFFNKHEEYNIMHTHIDQVSGIILETAKKCNVAVRISHSHSTANSNNIVAKIYKKYLQSKINKNATIKLACSVNAAKWLYKKEYNQAVIINNAIDTLKFSFNDINRNKIRKKLNIKDDEIVIGHIGRFSKVKNHKFLIDIFNQYQKKQKSILVLVGDGELIENVKRKVKKLNLESKVIFLGVQRNVCQIYSAFDMLVFPSLYEGLSLTMIEAQYNGLKILASDNIDKKVDISSNVYYEKTNSSAEKWANRMMSINMNREEQKNITDNYDIHEIVKKMQNIYLKEEYYENNV